MENNEQKPCENKKAERSKDKSFMLESSSPHSNPWHDLEIEHYKAKKCDLVRMSVRAEGLTHNLTHLMCAWWAVLQKGEGVRQKKTTGEKGEKAQQACFQL